MKYTFTTFIISLFFTITVFGKPINSKPHNTDTILYIHLKLNTYSRCAVATAPLKYNKHLAFGFTLDDGYHSAYLCAYKLLNGGQISASVPDEYHSDQGGDGTYSKGLFYSDGCNHQVPFKLALAINSGLLEDHPISRGRLSWAEVNEMYHAGWDIMNHGLYHRTQRGTDFYQEVVQNIDSVQKHLGYTMTQFVVPGGAHDPGYEHDYEHDAFKTGAFSVASYVGKGPIINLNDNIDLKELIYARTFIQSAHDSLNYALIDKHINLIDSMIKNPQPIWYNEFTHNVGDKNLWNLSLLFPEFKYYMTSIAKKYGLDGTDQLWMAPWQEVYEYVWIRQHAKVYVKQNGTEVVVGIHLSGIPSTFRHKALSLNVESKASFLVLSHSAEIKVTSNGTTRHNLLNIDIQ